MGRFEAFMIVKRHQPRWLHHLLLVAFAVGIATASPRSVRAQIYTWAPSGTASPGGSGTWDTTSAFWTTLGPLVAWPNTTSSTAAFGGATSGTVTLSGSLTAGLLRFDTSGYVLTGGTLGLGGTATVNTVATGTTTIWSVIAGSAGLTKTGNGVLVINPSSTYTGTTTISQGTLQVGNNSAVALPARAYRLDNGATLAFSLDVANNAISTATISGSGNVVFSGLATTNSYYSSNRFAAGGLTYTGTTTINFDNASNYYYVDLAANTPFPSTTILNVLRGRVSLRQNQTVAGLTGTSGDIGGGWGSGQTLTINAAPGASYTSATALINNGAVLSVTKSGAGLQALTGANTYTGSTTITGGTLQIGVGGTTGGIGSTSGIAVSSGAILAFNRSDNYGGSFSRVVTGSGGLNVLSGTLTLSGANTYSGPTTLSSGSLVAGSASAFGDASGAILAQGGVLNLGNFNITRTGTIQFAGATVQSGTLANNGVAFDARSGTVSASLAGSAGLTKTTSGTVTLSGANAYAGVTTVSNGVLQFVNPASLYNAVTGSWTAANVVVANGATLALTVGPSNFTTGNVTTLLTNLGGLGASVSNNGLQAGSTIGFDTSVAGSFTVADSIMNSTGPGGGAIGLVKLGSSTLTLSAASGYTGPTNVNVGTLSVTGSLASPVTVAGGAFLAGTGTVQATTVSALGGLAPGVGGVGRLSLASLAFSGSSAVTMGIQSGTVSSLLSVLGNVTTGGGVNSVNFDFGSSLASLSTGIYTLLSYGGTQLADVSAFTVSGTLNARSTLTLLNGTQAVNLGVVSAYPIWSGSFGSGWTTTDNWVLNTNGSPTTFVNTDAVVFDDSAVTGNVTISGTVSPLSTTFSGTTLAYTLSGSAGSGIATGSLVKSGPAILTISTSNSYAGGTVVNSGTIVAANPFALGATTGSLAVNAGGVDLSGNSVTVGTLSSSSGATITSASAATLAASSAANSTYAGTIAGALALTKSGVGTLTLTGSNTYSGATTISAGTLQVGSGGVAGSINASPTVAVSSGAVLGFNRSDTVTYSGTISGAGGVTQLGSGTLVLSPASTYTGPTTVNQGTLQLGSNTAVALPALGGYRLENGSTLVFSLNVANNVVSSATISGSGNVVFSGLATAGSYYSSARFASGGLTYTGTTTINFDNASNYYFVDLPGFTDAPFPSTTILNVLRGRVVLRQNQTVAGLTGTSGDIGGGWAPGQTLTINVASGASYSSATALINNGAVLSVTKSGGGTQTLTGANTYTGTTTVGNGILRFNSVATGSGAQGLGANATVNLGVASTSAGEIDYFGGTGTLDKNVLALGTGRNRIRNSGTGTLTLSGTLTKNGTILELAGGTFTVSGRITGTSANSDLLINGATVTLTNSNNDYNGPTYVYGNGSLLLGASNVVPSGSALLLGGTGADTGTGSIVTGTFTDTLASLTTSNLGATVGISVSGATAGGLTMGALTFGAGTDTLALSLASPSLGRYTLLTYTSRSGTFDSVSGAGNYNVVYGGSGTGTVDLQLKANQTATFTLTPAASRVLVGGSTTLSGALVNTSTTAASTLNVSLSSGGPLTANNFASSSGATLAAGGTSTITATVLAGPTAGTQSWSVINTDAAAITTTSTASGTIDVVNQRSFAVSTGTIALGNFLRTASVTGSTTISSSGLQSTTANAAIDAFLAEDTAGFNLSLASGTNVFNGGTALQQVTYALTGSATSAGIISGGFTAAVNAEIGTINPLTVSLTGTAYDPARASFTSGSTTVSWLVDVGSFNMNTGSYTALFDIHNLLADLLYTADLRLMSVTGVGTLSDSLSINVTPEAFGDLAAGDFSSWQATLFTTSAGSFTNTYQLAFTSAIGGSSLGGTQNLTLTVSGFVGVPEPSGFILAAVGLAGAALVRRRLRSTHAASAVVGR